MKGSLPAWFAQEPPKARDVEKVEALLYSLGLNTICNSAHCPNIGACFSQGTATFLILGDTCTRNCSFCAVKKGKPQPVDRMEPSHILEAARKLDLNYVVITSVTREDLPRYGAEQFAETISLLHSCSRKIKVEVLIPDFNGSSEALEIVIKARPNVIGHNVETVPRLYPTVRPMADYSRSVDLLARTKDLNTHIITKSGLMVGLGETREEVLEVMSDLREAECDLLTIGQYLRPSEDHRPVTRFIPPEEFAEYEQIGRKLGFADIIASPLVRSSYRAAEMYLRVKRII
jgi:lipoic acid synthetase